MKRICSLVVILLIICGLIWVSCQKKVEEKVVKIGAILPLTGKSSLLGEMAKNGLILAAKKINEKGGINGKKIKLIIEDGQADIKISLSAFRKLVKFENVNCIITTHSSVGLTLAPIANKEKIILIVHASHPKITGNSHYVFRHSNVADQEAKIITDFISNILNGNKISIAAMNDDYGMVFKNTLEELIPSKGKNFRIVASIIYEKTETDFKTVAQKLILSNPDVVVITGLGNGVGILIRRLREFGYQGNIVITLAAVATGAFQGTGESAKGLYYVNFDIDSEDPHYKEVAKEYKEMFNADFSAAPLIFYNSLILVAEAIQKAGTSPDKIANYLENIRSFKGIGERMDIFKEHDIVPKLKVEKKQ